MLQVAIPEDFTNLGNGMTNVTKEIVIKVSDHTVCAAFCLIRETDGYVVTSSQERLLYGHKESCNKA